MGVGAFCIYSKYKKKKFYKQTPVLSIIMVQTFNPKTELPVLINRELTEFEIHHLAGLRKSTYAFFHDSVAAAIRTIGDPTPETATQVVTDLAYIASTVLCRYRFNDVTIPRHGGATNGYERVFQAITGAGALMNGTAQDFYRRMAQYVRRDEKATERSYELVPRLAIFALSPIGQRGTPEDIEGALAKMDDFNKKTAREIFPRPWSAERNFLLPIA